MLFSGWGLGQPMTTSQSQLHARTILFLPSLFSFHLIPASAVSCKVLVGRQQSLCVRKGYSLVSSGSAECSMAFGLSCLLICLIKYRTSNQFSECLLSHQMPHMNSSLVTNPMKTVLPCPTAAHVDLTVCTDIYFIVSELCSQL